MLEIGLADEAGAAVRAATIVARRKAVDSQNAEPASGKLVKGRATRRPRSPTRSRRMRYCSCPDITRFFAGN